MSDKLNARWQSLAVFLCVSLSFLYLLNVSWFRWGSLVIDTFRNMNVCDKMLTGHVLYRDICYEYGFLPPLFLSALCRVFGLNIATFVGAGITISIIISFSLYRISGFFMGRAGSALVVLAYLFVVAFGLYDYIGIFNSILPYSFASMMFVCFSLESLYFFLKYILIRKLFYLYFWALIQALALLCRPDMGTAIWFCFAGSMILASFVGRRNIQTTGSVKGFIVLVFPLLAAAAAYCFFLRATDSWEGFKISCLKVVLSGLNKQLSSNMGMGSGLGSLLLMVDSLVVHGLGVITMMLGVILLSRLRGRSRGAALRAILLGAGAVCCAFVILYRSLFTGNAWIQYKCVPVLLVVGTIVYGIKAVKNENFDEPLTLFTVFFFSLAMVSRVFFIASPFSYSFCIIPGLICYYYVFMEAVPSCAGRFNVKPDKYLFKSLMAVMFVLFIGKYWNASNSKYMQKNMKVTTDVGVIFCFQDPASLHALEAVKYLVDETPPGAGVVVVPECMSINFLSRRQDPLKYVNLLPGTFVLFGDEAIVRDFNQVRPDYVVFAGRASPEHGSPFFGLTYGRKLYECILSDYKLVKQIGQYPFKADDFGIAIYRRNSGQDSEGKFNVSVE